VSIDVTNDSAFDGVDVVQLYLHQRFGTSSRPLRKLGAFRVVHVAAGATEHATFQIGPDERRYWSAATGDWVLDASEFDVLIGGDATAERSATFRVIA
jgi:beta-glucosidase